MRHGRSLHGSPRGRSSSPASVPPRPICSCLPWSQQQLGHRSGPDHRGRPRCRCRGRPYRPWYLRRFHPNTWSTCPTSEPRNCPQNERHPHPHRPHQPTTMPRVTRYRDHRHHRRVHRCPHSWLSTPDPNHRDAPRMIQRYPNRMIR